MSPTDRDRIASTLGRLKLFPLPDAVLLPGALVPLHIFEPRYRSMAKDAVDGDRVLAIATLEPGFEANYQGRPPVRPVCGAGVIERHERMPDGRYNVILRGVARVRLVEELPPTSAYREAKAVVVEDEPPSRPDAAETLRRYLWGVSARMPRELQAAVLRACGTFDSAGELADAVAAVLVPEAADRLALLEERRVDRRIEAVLAAATDALMRLTPEAGALKQ